MYIFRGTIGYWLKFGVAIPSSFDYTPINIAQDPIQTEYTDKEKSQKVFLYKSLINSNQMVIMPQAHYVMSAKAIAYNYDFIFISEFFDSAALYDLGSAWGEIADKNYFKKYIKTYSQKTELSGTRALHWEYKYGAPHPYAYLSSHIAHNHIVPANRNIMAGLLTIKLWDDIQLEGELIDMKHLNKKKKIIESYRTSMSREDEDYGDRGNGNCETIYLTKLRVGNRVYE